MIADALHRQHCSKCGVNRPLSDFPMDMRRKPWHPHKRCILCKRHADRERYRLRYHADADFRAAGKKRARAVVVDETRRSARLIAQRACRDGKLQRPDSCEQCHQSGVPIEAHHEDYSRPLCVIWLCRACHKRLHRKAVA